MKKINELNVLITGGTRGIGLATALLLSKKVNNVFVCGRKKSNSELLDKHKIEFIKTDLTKENEIVDLYNTIINKNIKIDVLINNAGFAFFKPFLETDIKEVRDLFEINFFSVYNCINSFLPDMISNNYGKIININSVVTKKVFPSNTSYSATKLALKGLTSSLRQEVRSKGVDIIDIYPGATETDIWDKSTIDQREGRMMEIEDVAQGIYSVLELSMNSRLIPEEITLRPKLGDL